MTVRAITFDCYGTLVDWETGIKTWAASLLAKKKKLRISINLPREPAEFYDEIRAGIRAESEELAQAAIELESRSFPELGDGEIEAFQSAIAAKVDGIIATFGPI